MKQVDYGIDKPERVRAFAMVGAVLIATGLAQFIALRANPEDWPLVVLSVCLWVGLLMFMLAAVMLWSSKSGKYGLSWKMLEEMKWMGREKVLDVGCGRGLLTILAARKVPLGDVVGIDIWNQEQLSDNSIEGAFENARIEQVSERVNFQDGDAMDMNFRSGSFDKVISSLTLHSISKREDRDRAVVNLIKVLKPGGEIGLLDILHTSEYMRIMKKQGLRDIKRSPMKFLYCLPTRYVIGRKP